MARHRRDNGGRRARAALWLGVGLLAAGCAGAARTPPSGAGAADKEFPLFAAENVLMEGWRFVRVWGRSRWQLVAVDEEVAIEGKVDGSSSALARWIDIDTALCPIAEWSWRVDQLPDGADLSRRASDDVAASVFFVFGDPGTLANPAPVPTLRYVWSTAANPAGSVIDSPYFPGTLRSLVVRSGTDETGRWVTERRDLRADFITAFGEPPPEPVRVIALFTDNDHLKVPVRSLYRSASAYCTELPDDI